MNKLKLIWAIIWRAVIGSTIAWNVVGGPLTPSIYYPEIENLQRLLGDLVLLTSILLSCWWVLKNKQRWLGDDRSSDK